MPAPDAAERLLNLLIALTHTRHRLTRAEIRATVAGYDPEDDRDDDKTARKRTMAFERMFERDKDDLRRLGVPLKTVTDPTHGDEIGYIIDAGDAAMPPVSLTAVERAIIAVAADYWQSASLGTDARRGLVKMTALTSHLEDVPLHLSARSLAGVDAAPIIAQAMMDRQAIRFSYTSGSSGKAIRTVEPWRLIVRGGALYLVGFDRDRRESRTYRLSRIEEPVRPIGNKRAFDTPDTIPSVDLEAGVPTLTARIGLRSESGHALRRRGVFVESAGEWDLFDIPYSDTDALRDEVLGLAGAARVISPDSLAKVVCEHARAALGVARG